MGSTNPSGLVIIFFYAKVSFLSSEWVDYVEEPMKYQALRPHFSPWVGGGGGVGDGGREGWLVVGWGGWMYDGDGGTHLVDMWPCGCFISILANCSPLLSNDFILEDFTIDN